VPFTCPPSARWPVLLLRSNHWIDLCRVVAAVDAIDI
jgi:hypothetical protein